MYFTYIFINMKAFGIIRMLTVGWMPGYLVFNASGPKKYRYRNNYFSSYQCYELSVSQRQKRKSLLSIISSF